MSIHFLQLFCWQIVCNLVRNQARHPRGSLLYLFYKKNIVTNHCKTRGALRSPPGTGTVLLLSRRPSFGAPRLSRTLASPLAKWSASCRDLLDQKIGLKWGISYILFAFWTDSKVEEGNLDSPRHTRGSSFWWLLILRDFSAPQICALRRQNCSRSSNKHIRLRYLTISCNRNQPAIMIFDLLVD